MAEDPSLFLLFSVGDRGWGDELLAGLWVTLRLWVLSFAIGMVIGIAGAGAKLSHLRALRWIAETYTTIVRGVPEILVIFLLYFGGAQVLQAILALFVGEEDAFVDIDAFAAGTAALAFVCGAYCTEVFRGAIQAVPHGQIEAAEACGMHRPLIWRRILLPQVLRIALPGLGNVFLTVQKDTAIISVVGLDELVRATAIAASATRLPFTFYLALAALFLAMTAAAQIGLYFLERRYGRGQLKH